jgi:hypothetical protein
MYLRAARVSAHMNGRDASASPPNADFFDAPAPRRAARITLRSAGAQHSLVGAHVEVILPLSSALRAIDKTRADGTPKKS